MSLCSAVSVAAQSSVCANKVPKKLHCFSACYGFKRTIVEQTIHDFCASHDGTCLNKDGPAGTIRGYTPKPNTAKKGKIHMKTLAPDDGSCGT
ncbi:hypothetical protein D0864_02133 [Hortaea werneckii]|uniref:Uncharacterized protein n=1 Tax=Hortaea werneckii TaxID=91943 RepID=A0A3M7GE97_HORWE|nr:hypothetical protein D0863_02192 [Hortaea werneckii]RMY99413.1 hypothetical protein D0862_07129 [Hortaea werneckii]RMZ06858.1 hypothetical protein D0864_02133 [Hortaea werneckii]